jgi:tetratricopeptide (TPR) repeat protein
LLQRALASLEKALWPDHAITLRTLEILGSIYEEQGKLVEVEMMYRRELAGHQRILGPGHATTTEKLYRLGMIYGLQRKTAKAEEMYRQALESFENLFGPDVSESLPTFHSVVRAVLCQLALTSREEGRILEAEQLEISFSHFP